MYQGRREDIEQGSQDRPVEKERVSHTDYKRKGILSRKNSECESTRMGGSMPGMFKGLQGSQNGCGRVS